MQGCGARIRSWCRRGTALLLCATGFGAAEGASVNPNCHDGQAKWPSTKDSIVTPASLSWSRKRLPRDIEAALMKAYEWELDEEDKAQGWYAYAWFDLVGDDTPELIAEFRSLGGTGGRYFAILERQKGRWRTIDSFMGGFVAVRTAHKFEELTIWRRYGGHEYSRTVARYSESEKTYVSGEPVAVPPELSSLNTGWVDLFRFFWFLNGGQPGCFGGQFD